MKVEIIKKEVYGIYLDADTIWDITQIISQDLEEFIFQDNKNLKLKEQRRMGVKRGTKFYDKGEIAQQIAFRIGRYLKNAKMENLEIEKEREENVG